jgi:hypothetical protein
VTYRSHDDSKGPDYLDAETNQEASVALSLIADRVFQKSGGILIAVFLSPNVNWHHLEIRRSEALLRSTEGALFDACVQASHRSLEHLTYRLTEAYKK